MAARELVPPEATVGLVPFEQVDASTSIDVSHLLLRRDPAECGAHRIVDRWRGPYPRRQVPADLRRWHERVVPTPRGRGGSRG